MAQVATLRAINWNGEKPIAELQGARLPVGRDPQIAPLIKGNIIRRANRADLLVRIAREVCRLIIGLASQQKNIPY